MTVASCLTWVTIPEIPLPEYSDEDQLNANVP